MFDHLISRTRLKLMNGQQQKLTAKPVKHKSIESSFHNNQDSPTTHHTE